ncbi:uncharacterized protein LOC111433394 [Cucurbita moschata]|uniref:Uncharacterized protein LOC111433394 n=1 Tax=Cucurbita moschata TaxID=3662 RepID=A0A6J1EEI2_CUCMO|nr:uncharacterized protein LOC111433394 [Cucurbita moschata]
MKEKKKMTEQNIQQIELGAQLNREFENPAMMANQERITANAIHLADDRERAIRAYAHPAVEELNPCIIRPEMQATTFELKPVMFQMLQTIGQFHGLPSEDPHLHLKSFLGVSDSFRFQRVDKDVIRLSLFPYSLRDGAKSWLNTLALGTIDSWNSLVEKFLIKYFPPTRNARFRNEIVVFQQFEDDTLSEAWERFKEMLRKCPHHGLPHCIQMETFYNGLNIATKQVVDASANGAILSKTYNEAYEILERIASNNCQWADVRSNPGRKTRGVLEVDALSSINAQLASVTNILQNLALGQDSMIKAPVHTVAVINQTAAESCVYCGEEHTFDQCPSNPASIFYVGNQASQGNPKNNPFSNTYNPGWRNHPNFSWKGQGSYNQQMPPKANYPPGFGLQNQLAYSSQQVNTQGKGIPQAQYTLGTSIESLIKEYMAKNDVVIQNQQASLRNLEVQTPKHQKEKAKSNVKQ